MAVTGQSPGCAAIIPRRVAVHPDVLPVMFTEKDNAPVPDPPEVDRVISVLKDPVEVSIDNVVWDPRPMVKAWDTSGAARNDSFPFCEAMRVHWPAETGVTVASSTMHTLRVTLLKVVPRPEDADAKLDTLNGSLETVLASNAPRSKVTTCGAATVSETSVGAADAKIEFPACDNVSLHVPAVRTVSTDVARQTEVVDEVNVSASPDVLVKYFPRDTSGIPAYNFGNCAEPSTMVCSRFVLMLVDPGSDVPLPKSPPLLFKVTFTV